MSILDIFRVNKIKAELLHITDEYDRLKSAMAETAQMNAYQLTRVIEILQDQKKQLERDVQTAEADAGKRKAGIEATIRSLDDQIATKQSELIQLDDEILLQSFGLYKSRYALDTSEQYKAKLDEIRDKQASSVKLGTAVVAAQGFTLNGSAKEGAKMVKDYVKIILRSFNNECDASIINVKFNNMESIEKKIQKAFDTLNNLGARMQISIARPYLNLKLEELYLCHEYQQKKQQEKEEQKRIREQMREEARLMREIEEMRLKLEKEEKHFNKAIAALDARIQKATTETERNVLEEERRLIQEKIAEIAKERKEVDYREQNTRAGYVYIVSNLGSFGENIYKIGVTRRLEPMDRVDELGDASVPFDFDVHALIFSDDAPALENALHKAFQPQRLNLVNLRREFFRVTLDDIERVVRTNFRKPVEFNRVLEAAEFRESLLIRNGAGHSRSN